MHCGVWLRSWSQVLRCVFTYSKRPSSHKGVPAGTMRLLLPLIPPTSLRTEISTLLLSSQSAWHPNSRGIPCIGSHVSYCHVTASRLCIYSLSIAHSIHQPSASFMFSLSHIWHFLFQNQLQSVTHRCRYSAHGLFFRGAVMWGFGKTSLSLYPHTERQNSRL